MLQRQEEDGNELWTFEKILDHRTTRNDNKILVEVKVLWDTGEETWELLNTMKADDPITIAQYAKEKNLQDQPYWKWTKRYLKNPKKFIRYCRQVHLAKTRNTHVYPFGVRIPKNIKEALALDKINGNNLWKEAIKKEMLIMEDFQVFREVTQEDNLKDCQFVPCHFVFDCKFDGRRKARFVAGGHKTEVQHEDAYSGVISLDAVRLAMFNAVHNNLHVIAADIGSAYLHSQTKEKLYTILDPEYGTLGGRRIIIHKG